MQRSFYLLFPLLTLLSACGKETPTPAAITTAATSTPERIHNLEATVPPQCYTRTQGQFNPCYTCHQTRPDSNHPNQAADGHLQAAYAFSDFALENHWKNLFVDRRPAIARISNAEILSYVRQDNYSALPAQLRTRGWQGYTPDLANLSQGPAAFDAQGFAKDGSGWRAFNYKPLPSTFWPTNGSTDDVMLRLPPAFRQDASGQPSTAIYRLNLDILELAIQERKQMDIDPVDESTVAFDVNGDGRIKGMARTLRRPGHYAGQARTVPVTPALYPQGTEFLHSVRYLDPRPDGVQGSARMKELRYMQKVAFYTPAQLNYRYGNERQEKQEEELPSFVNLGDMGLSNGFGWRIQGFIEASDGQLRPQSREEQLYCMGCHTALGSTIDQTFAFPRKLSGSKGWGYIDLRGMPDAPQRGQRQGEIRQYLERVGGGDEFRQNAEMRARFFRADGKLDERKLAGKDVYQLITPSSERALALNKAYRVIVREQSFRFGRDASITPMRNVFERIDPATAPTLSPDVRYDADIRLDWTSAR